MQTESIIDTENNDNDSCLKYCKEKFIDLGIEINECFLEINYECLPKNPKKVFKRTLDQLVSWVHIPYFPPIHHPGWLTTYIVGPYNEKYIEVLISDVIAGLTVSLTCIPQAMSYASIAYLPPVNGLYASITPSLAYTLFGSSMQLQVGPVAVVSLLTGALLSKYKVDYINDPQAAIDCGCQAALCAGILLSLMGILNMGNFINFMAHPVMSGFTSAAACLIGLSQLKDAFGFIVPASNKIPALGVDVEYNYEIMEWYAHNWNNKWTVADATDSNGIINEDVVGMSYQNHYSIALCFTIYAVLISNFIFKQRLHVTEERKQKIWYKVWKTINPLLPFVVIVISASIVFNLKNNSNNFYSNHLKIVGKITAGIDFVRIPKFPFPFGQMIIDVIPITLVSFMESYSVSRRIASQNNQLFLLNASQEMFANGAANLAASLSSGYPVSGSFSRSSLNATAGGKTPLASIIVICVILIALELLTSSFEYIPYSALAGIIFVAITNLISIHDFWEAWKYSRKDFFTMIVTFFIVLCFDTTIGLICGLACALLVFLTDVVFSKQNNPELINDSRNNNGIDVIKLESDINFLTSARIKNFISALTIKEPEKPDFNNTNDGIRGDYYHYVVSFYFDKILRPRLTVGVDVLPLAIVIDLSIVRVVDITGIETIKEIIHEARLKGILVVVINASSFVESQLERCNIKNDASTDLINLDEYLLQSNLPIRNVNNNQYLSESSTSIDLGQQNYDLVHNDVELGEIELNNIQLEDNIEKKL